jgi:ATP-binding cassette subfamily B protein/subfamily B ATP-binding cassette protein MsbA
MTYFVRALRDAAKSWPLLLAAFLCSAGVASLWGANIAALFPIIEVTLNGDSLQEWNARRIDEARKRIEIGRQQEEAINAQLAAGMLTPDQATAARNTLDTVALNKRGDEALLYSSEKLDPWLHRFLPDDPFTTVLWVVAFVVASTFIKHAFLLTNTLLVTWVAMNISRDIRLKVFDKALAVDRQQFMRHGSAGFMAQVTGTSDMLASGITSVFGGAVTEPLKILACLGGAFCISWQLTLACLTLAPLVGFMMVWLNRRIRGISKKILTKSLGFHHVLLEAFNNVLTVQAYTMEDFERDRFRTCTKDMLKTGMKHTFYYALANPITEVLGIGMVATSIAVGAWLACVLALVFILIYLHYSHKRHAKGLDTAAPAQGGPAPQQAPQPTRTLSRRQQVRLQGGPAAGLDMYNASVVVIRTGSSGGGLGRSARVAPPPRSELRL